MRLSGGAVFTALGTEHGVLPEFRRIWKAQYLEQQWSYKSYNDPITSYKSSKIGINVEWNSVKKFENEKEIWKNLFSLCRKRRSTSIIEFWLYRRRSKHIIVYRRRRFGFVIHYAVLNHGKNMKDTRSLKQEHKVRIEKTDAITRFETNSQHNLTRK